MATLLLVIIYITFISLGLPDPLLGSAWTIMRPDLGAKLADAGILSIIISGGTIVSSLMSERLLRRFKTGPVTAFSVLFTAAALAGFAAAPSFRWLALASVPLGIGAGAVDTALNNYIAVHYRPHHMSWLHCFWGVGAFSGPFIMARFIQSGDWRGGYMLIGAIQFALTAVLFAFLPVWMRIEREGVSTRESVQNAPAHENSAVLKIPGVPMAMLTFFSYSGVEATAGMWGASYLADAKGMPPDSAARWTAFFFVGITIGRFLTGFLTLKFTSRALIRAGQIFMIFGLLLLILPLPEYFSPVGLCVAGLGCAPVFPCMIHETPYRFGVQKSQKIMGIQMASAYTGSTFLPPLLGLIAQKFTGIGIYPYALALYSVVMLAATESLNRKIGKPV